MRLWYKLCQFWRQDNMPTMIKWLSVTVKTNCTCWPWKAASFSINDTTPRNYSPIFKHLIEIFLWILDLIDRHSGSNIFITFMREILWFWMICAFKKIFWLNLQKSNHVVTLRYNTELQSGKDTNVLSVELLRFRFCLAKFSPSMWHLIGLFFYKSVG